MSKKVVLFILFQIFYLGYSQGQKIDMSFKNEQYPYLIGQYKGLIIDGKTIYSYANCPLFPPGGGSNLGDNWFVSYLGSGYSSKYYGAKELLKNVYINNNQKKYQNSIFSILFENDELILTETKVINDKLTKKKRIFKIKFEIKSNDVIETYEIKEAIAGSGLILFSAKSQYSEKSVLFVGNIENDKLIPIDLSKIDNRFNSDKYGGTILGIENIGKQNVSRAKRYSINSVFQHENTITVFISFKFGDTNELKAFQINSNTNNIKMSNTRFICGINSIDIDPSSKYDKQGGIYFLPEKGEFLCIMPGADKKNYLNYNDNKNIDFKLTHFDNNLNKKNEIVLNNFTYINHITDVGNFIIVGGYTKTKGYAGFPNPIVAVINKSSFTITYEKCIPQKNCTIDIIKSDGENIFMAVSGSFDRYNPINPFIIVDKLNSTGKFENDLFITK